METNQSTQYKVDKDKKKKKKKMRADESNSTSERPKVRESVSDQVI